MKCAGTDIAGTCGNLGCPAKNSLELHRYSHGWMGKEDKYDRGHPQSFVSIQKQATQVLVILTETQSNAR